MNTKLSEESTVTDFMDVILTTFEIAFYFSLVVFVMNVIFYVTFMIGFELNVIQPLKQSASENNAVLESELKALIDTFESDFTSYILFDDKDEAVNFYLGDADELKGDINTPRYELYSSYDEVRVSEGLEEVVDNHNSIRSYANQTSYTAIQQMQNFKLKLRVPIKVDVIGFASFVYYRDFYIDVVAMDNHDHLPSYNTLEKGSINTDDIDLPVLGTSVFNYKYYLDDDINNGQINNLIFSKNIE